MREIKFRAWDTESKFMWDWDEMQEWWEDVGYHDNMLRGNHYVPMQYTEIKDKNGKEIYEGDIVYMRCDGISGFGEVIFENGCFWIDDKKRKRTYPLYNEGVYRVDGNIFENPELLGE